MNDDIVGSSLSASASPQRSTPKTHHHFFGGLLSKRSTKVEPHPVHEQQQQQQQEIENKSKTKVKTKTKTENQLPNASSLSLQNDSIKNNNNNNNKSDNGLLAVQRRSKSKSKNCVHRHSTTDPGSFSDSGEVIMRATPTKHRSPNHNRFSHQFSLCCKAEKKAATPPVTVRYNSIPDTSSVVNPLRRDNLSLNWTIGTDPCSLSLNSSDNNINQSQASAKVISVPPLQSECVSAPESPVTAKSSFMAQTMVSSYGSPSSSSQRSTQSGVTVMSAGKSGNGPIRPIAVSACRSRLRLKLYPPEKEEPAKVLDFKPETLASKMKLATTPQHMSSPNIPAQHLSNSNSNVSENNNISDYDVLPFMSHENIQISRQIPGLARQSLLAAQMLSLIPTEQARERSFLDGRLCSSSLLGPSELNRILPDKKVTIFVGTWNMNGQNPPKQMNDFVLPLSVEHIPDIVAIGTQESSPDRFEWEVTLQETLGPSHVLFHATTLGTLHLVVYMRRDLIWYCSEPEDASMSVRHGSAFRTKGAVAISFCLFGTSMLFVTSHLTAHQQKVKERVSDVKRIIHALDLPKNLHLRHKNKDVTQNFDNVFWCGDLNFRLSEPREKLLEWIKNTKFPLPSHLPHGYMHTDQLSSVLSDGAAFRGFMEANITFPPTYKYDPGTQHFDTSSKQRAPAYTDRILYKYRQVQGLAMRRQSSISGQPLPVQPHVQCLLYDSVPSIITSDHKPVWALFSTVIRAGTDSIPLAAGLFSREIYLEGMKRRLNNQYSGSSAVCVIQ